MLVAVRPVAARSPLRAGAGRDGRKRPDKRQRLEMSRTSDLRDS
jgi:hypothetical protein